uniref:Uncharacterized protein n=1 Tax=Daphnia galeata TaxID=27404 RepID=A0A8J2S039_9CRUS|nr:unnamed protein product [Daphnia galeata]
MTRNGTREFFDKTLYINNSSLHHRTTNEPSSSNSSMATLSHLNINKSHDEKIVPNFKSTENQGMWTVNYTIAANDSTTSSFPGTRSPSVHNQSTVVTTAERPIEGGTHHNSRKENILIHTKISAVDQLLKPGWEPGNFSETHPYWLSQGNSTHAETLNVTNKREIGINPELMSTGYYEIQMISTRNDSSKTNVSHDWNYSTKATNESLRTTKSSWTDPSSRRSNTTTPPAKVWGFPFDMNKNHSSGTFNSSTPDIINAHSTMSSLWRNITSSSRPSAKKFLTGTPHQFSSKTERGEPWNKSETHGQNHFNSIVNVRVDSGAETLEKMIRLEAVIASKMGEMERMAKAMAADLKSRLNRLEATLLNKVESPSRTEEMKQHLESLIDVKSRTLERELKKFKCAAAAHQDAKATQHAQQTTNEPITSEIEQLRDSLKTHQPLLIDPESKSLDRKQESLAEWRAKRTKLMERWESNFQRGLSSQRKSTTQKSTRNLS